MNRNYHETVNLYGSLISDFLFNHTNHRESYYRTKISVRYPEGIEQYDLIIPDHLIDVTLPATGRAVDIIGEFRAFPGRRQDDDNCYIYVNSIMERQRQVA